MCLCVCKESLRTKTRPGSCKAGGWQENPGRRVSVKRRRRSPGRAWALAARGVCEARRRRPRGGGGPAAGGQGLPAFRNKMVNFIQILQNYTKYVVSKRFHLYIMVLLFHLSFKGFSIFLYSSSVEARVLSCPVRSL